MSDEHEPRKLFSEKQISTILRRATEMQEASMTTDPTGLTFEELQQIAVEAGIDAKYIAAAITEQEQEGDVDERFYWLGAPTSIERERVVAGEVSDEQWEEMVAEIRSTFGLVGASGQVGRSREWTHDSKEQQAQVTVTSREGQTKIRLFARYPQLAALAFIPGMTMGILIPIFLIEGLGLPAAPGVFVFIAVMATLFMGLRFLYSRLARGKQRKAQQLLARLEQIVAEPATEVTPTPLPEARLDASLLTEEAEPEEAPTQAQSRTKTSS